LTKIPLPDIQLTAGGLHLQLDGGELTLSDAERGHRLVVMPVAGCMMPWLDGSRAEISARPAGLSSFSGKQRK
jgi:hypothetical protein